MKQHEREYFISQIRSGTVYVTKDDITLTIVNPTVEQYLESCLVFEKSFLEAYRNDVMSHDEMILYLREQGIWSQKEEDRIEGLKKDLDRLRVEIFNARNNSTLAEQIRMYIRAGENQLVDVLSLQFEYYNNTREGIASGSQSIWLIEHCTFLNNELYDFKDMSELYVLTSHKESILPLGEIRELSRNEPWKSLWMTRNDSKCNLFIDVKDKELSDNQKNLLIWSQLYDNIQESMDCPSEVVIDDNDMLDGWFIVQSQKREKEKSESEFEDYTKSDKIKNSDEIFMMAGSNQDVGRIQNMNDIGGKITVKQREATIKRGGGKAVSQNEFRDEQLKLQRDSNQKYKSKLGG